MLWMGDCGSTEASRVFMLIIPSLTIQGTLCASLPVGEEGTQGRYPCHPVAAAKMWRGENAKAIHIEDNDGARLGTLGNKALIREITASLDIAVQLAGGVESFADAKEALTALGIYRVVVGPAVAGNPELLKALVEEFGPRKIVVPLLLDDESGWNENASEQVNDAVARAGEYKKCGIERLLVRDLIAERSCGGPRYETLVDIADRSGLCITVSGTVRNYQDLKKLQLLRPSKIDSLILGEPLYINAFPCQRIWRLAEKELIHRDKFY